MDRLNLKYTLYFSAIYICYLCVYLQIIAKLPESSAIVFRIVATLQTYRFPPTLSTIFTYFVHNQGTSLAMIHSIGSALPNGNQICV